MTSPSHAEIHAVRGVLYSHAHLAPISAALQNMATVMNLNDQATLPASDVRAPAGSGPQWYYPDSGALDANVTMGAHYARQIAFGLQGLRSAIAGVSFPEADKQYLMTALNEEAAAWNLRAQQWSDPKPPADVENAAALVQGHLTACAQARAKCNPAYFEDIS